MSPKSAFQKQRANAHARGIEFLLTFDEWWAIWADYFHMRGRSKNCLCMARKNDQGAYAVGNVYLTTNLGNVLDMDRSKRLMADDERIALQHKRDRKCKKTVDFDRSSDLAYKEHCRQEKVMAK